MGDELSRIDTKLERILDVLNDHSVEMARHGLLHEQNSVQLATHIARTNALEEHMDAEHREMKKNLETALIPIKSVKWLAALAVGSAAVATALRSLGIMK